MFLVDVVYKLIVFSNSFMLYLLSLPHRDGKVFDMLLDEIIAHKLALKATLNNIELLVFSSQELPQLHWSKFK